MLSWLKKLFCLHNYRQIRSRFPKVKKINVMRCKKCSKIKLNFHSGLSNAVR